MRPVVSRSLVAVMLGCWLVSACLGQLVSFHVETAHDGHHHAEPHGPEPLGGAVLLDFHAEAPGAHEHLLSTARSPGMPSPRILAIAPILAVLPSEWSEPVPRQAPCYAPTPRPRGSPQLHTILLI